MRAHGALGPGLLESTYSACLAHELAVNGIPFEREKPLPVRYREILLETEFRVDMLVADEVVLEIKAVEKSLPVHESQLLTYLKLSNRRVGLLINFNVRLLKDGIRRVIL